MSNDNDNSAATVALGELFDRLAAQLADTADGEQQQADATAALERVVDEPALRQVVRGAVASHREMAGQAQTLAKAVASIQQEAQGDLDTLVSLAAMDQ